MQAVGGVCVHYSQGPCRLVYEYTVLHRTGSGLDTVCTGTWVDGALGVGSRRGGGCKHCGRIAGLYGLSGRPFRLLHGVGLQEVPARQVPHGWVAQAVVQPLRVELRQWTRLHGVPNMPPGQVFGPIRCSVR